jgi:hypothetical protein
MSPNDADQKTPYLRRLIQTMDVLEKCYCISFNSAERFYAWTQGMSPEAPLQFTYPSSVETWHEAISVADAQQVAPVVIGALTVNTVITLTMWLEGYLRDICRVLYQHTQDGTWFLEPKLNRVDWKVVESVTGVKFTDVLCFRTIERAFEIRDFAFRYADNGADPGVSREFIVKLLHDVKIFAVDFEMAFFFAHPNITPAMIENGNLKHKLRLK